MCPDDAFKTENKSIVLYNLETHYKKSINKRRRPKFSINQRVRIIRLSKNRELSRKTYIPSFTEEIFTIIKVDKRLPFTRYYIKDINNEPIDGEFQAYELTKVT